MLDSWPTSTMSSLVSAVLVSTTLDSSSSLTCMSATCSDDSRSLMRPVSRRSVLVVTRSLSRASISLYRAMSSRYDLGVVYTLRLSEALYCSAAAPTLSCTCAMCWPAAARCSGVSISTSSRKRAATEMSASWGQPINQSMVVQPVSDGNLRQRTRKVSPTGDMHMTTWRLARTLSMKYFQQLSRESRRPADFTSVRMPLMAASLSSSE
mmetsp:Transcript_14442/g.43946  ORF Transcript_14442/g.43946 Transcript_14442/m.43946 type:complete len:209 (-) Transcript_14442:260-886(-)